MYSTIKEMIYDVTKKYSKNNAFLIPGKDKDVVGVSYEEFLEDFENFGTGLLKLGIGQGKTAIIGKNSYEWAISFFSTICGNGVAVPLDKELSDKEIINCVTRIEADTIVYSKEFAERINKMKEVLPTKNYICMNDTCDISLAEIIEIGKKAKEEGFRDYLDIKIDKDEVKECIFTSGTTSVSKIVMLSQYNIISNVQNAKKMIEITEDDTFLSVLPIHHTFENTCGLVTPICSGASIYYNDSLKNIMRDFKQVHPTVILVVPRMMEVFHGSILKGINKSKKKNLVNGIIKTLSPFKKMTGLKRKLFKDIHKQFGEDLRLIIVGGAAADSKISKFMRTIGFDVLQGYGLTECSPMVTVNGDKEFRDDSVGKPIPGTKVMIADPDESGVGEIVVSGPQVMKGYYQDEDATKSAITDEGYFCTGDLGIQDKKGFIYIKGRCKNLIIASNGKNIYPEEIEEIVNKHCSIKECMVYSKENENNKLDLCVDIVLIDEIREKIAEFPQYREEIMKVVRTYIEEVNADLPEYKRINKFNICDEEFEKTTTLKIKRYLKK